MIRYITAFIILTIALAAAEDVVVKRVYETSFLENKAAPQIDGILDDDSWSLVDWSGDYIEWSPQENTAPSQQTRLKILYDDKNLYVAFECFDSHPDSIVERLSRRDGFDGDWVEINIDSYFDKRTAFSFTITAAGVKGEEFITDNGNNWDATWNPIWHAKTNVGDTGWTAEIRIPLSQLRFSKEAGQIWGIQSTRRYFRKEERSTWQRSPLNAAGWVSGFGELHGLQNLQPRMQWALKPYASGSLKTCSEAKVLR
ncbi:MAG: carbohydrate binding family 9 domain-containing protein, partial [Calditrichota bacterium]